MQSVGQSWREGIFLMSLEAREAQTVDFAFGGGFGCEASVKVNQGQRLTLQKQHKITRQIGAKLTVPGG